MVIPFSPDKLVLTPRAVQVLLIEDSTDDVVLIREHLASESPAYARWSYEITAAETLQDGLNLLTDSDWDIVLLDLRLPDSVGAETFRKAHAASARSPILLLTHNADEELAIALLGEGAQDYLFKGELRGGVLRRSMHYALQRFAILQEKHELIDRLEKALGEVKRLQALVPICSRCKKIRTDDGFWRQVDQYMSEHTDTKFTHGLCPDCARKTYTEHHESGE